MLCMQSLWRFIHKYLTRLHCFNSNRDVGLQGARALPVVGDGSCTRPDQSIGIGIGIPSSSATSAWQRLCAGKAILPLDLVEFKKDTDDLQNGQYAVVTPSPSVVGVSGSE